MHALFQPSTYSAFSESAGRLAMAGIIKAQSPASGGACKFTQRLSFLARHVRFKATQKHEAGAAHIILRPIDDIGQLNPAQRAVFYDLWHGFNPRTFSSGPA